MSDIISSAERSETEMEHTRNVWVRHNLENDEIEIWYNGICQVSWANHSKIKIENRLVTMLSQAFEIGQREKLRELREFLGTHRA